MNSFTIKVCIGIISLFLAGSINAQGLKDHLPGNKYIGTALSSNYLVGGGIPAGYEETFLTDFNCIVSENDFKMAYMIPDRPSDPFNLTISDFSTKGLAEVDKLLELAEDNSMRVRGHTLIWYNQAPDWLISDAKSWTKQQIFNYAESYITTFLNYCEGKVDEWDVVNEAINDDSTPGFRIGTWYDNVSDVQAFIDHCFTAARAAAPDVDLFYNDYNIETKYHAKNGFMLNMVKDMTDRNIPIDGIGLQSHLTSGEHTNVDTDDALEATIKTLATYGLNCNLTELDIRICDGTTDAKLEEQGDEFQNITDIFLRNTNCNSLVFWGFTDASSWIPSAFNGCDDALLYDKSMAKKPAYIGVLNSIRLFTGNLSGPYLLEKQNIPGKIEAEHYDYELYADNDAENKGGAFREDSVDITEGNTGYVVGWTEAGEYLSYTVDVSTTDTFHMSIIYSSDLPKEKLAEVEILIDENRAGSIYELESTGSLNTYISLEQSGIILKKGEHKLTINILEGGINIDYLQFIAYNRNAIPIPGVLQVEDYNEGENGATYFDSSIGNEGGAYRTDDVDVAGTGDAGGGYVVAWISDGEWLEYSVNIDETAEYDLTIRTASIFDNGSFRILINNKDISGIIKVGSTGDWNSFKDTHVADIPLVDGLAILRLEIITGNFNFNYINFEKSKSLDIGEMNSSDIIISPNPFHNFIQIKGLDENENWTLFSSNGRIITSGNSNTIDCTRLESGLYLLKTENNINKLIKR